MCRDTLNQPSTHKHNNPHIAFLRLLREGNFKQEYLAQLAGHKLRHYLGDGGAGACISIIIYVYMFCVYTLLGIGLYPFFGCGGHGRAIACGTPVSSLLPQNH